MSFVEIPEEDLKTKTVVIKCPSVLESGFNKEQENIDALVDKVEKQNAQNILDAKKAIINVLPDFNTIPEVRKVDDLNKEDVKRKIIKRVEQNLSKGQQNIFKQEILKEVEEVYEIIVGEFKKNIIEIPRMDLVQGETRVEFEFFDLDTSSFNFQALEQEIIRMGLTDRKVETIKAKSSGSYGNLVNLLIAELIDYPEIDYDENADLLYHLTSQAYEGIKDKIDAIEKLPEAIFQFKSAIANKIYLQMKDHFVLHSADYLPPKVLPFVQIEPWSFSALLNAGYKDYRDIVTPTNTIPKYVFRGFEKACHFEYKFDSKAEQDLAFVLENDQKVEKWLRPAPNQFRIYWDNNSKRYEPDFIVETNDSIFMVEVKRADQTEEETVLAKKAAAEKYCEHASKFTLSNEGKPWKYLILPHNEVSRTVSLDYLVSKFG
ncbi:MAG: TnsA endonuclease N-terminal domain-containing protein [Saprospiraceae bacterium]